jgi:hypothetical protein
VKLKSVLLAGLSESILQGFENSWDVDVPIGPGIGTADLTFTDSNFSPVGLPEDSPHVDFSDPGNIDADPIFVGPDTFAPKITGLKAPKLKRNAKRGLNNVVVKGGKL